MRELATAIDSGLDPEVVTCGSYRRGKPTCGDIDILITHPDGRSHRGKLSALLERGHECGFFTDDLTVSEEANGSGKYLGVCNLEGEGRKVRADHVNVCATHSFFSSIHVSTPINNRWSLQVGSPIVIIMWSTLFWKLKLGAFTLLVCL